MLFVLITMFRFSFIQYTNTWLTHKAIFITRDRDIYDITTSTGDRGIRDGKQEQRTKCRDQCVRSSKERERVVGWGGGGRKGVALGHPHY